MSPRNPQAPAAVIMIRPHHFQSNPQTMQDNGFQIKLNEPDPSGLKQKVFEQVSETAELLQANGIKVHMFEDKSEDTPDSVFPNNWFSTHSGGHVAIYPMYAENRRKERRTDVIEMLKHQYRVQDVVDYSGLEQDKLYLEGTGAMVLDHIERVVYAVQSNRTNPLALERFCTHFNYEPTLFEAYDSKQKPIYHTNVLMCIGTDFVMMGLDLLSDETQRKDITQRFEDSGRELIALSNEQIYKFCGNAIELQGSKGRILALSVTACNALTSDQRKILEKSTTLLPLDVSSIESAGGSVRCMLAGIHLSPR
jgi:hypothetical protein